MRIHILMHESFEAPAAIADWAQSKNHTVDITRFYQNDKLPDNVNGFDLLVVMGGPQSPETTVEECPHYDAIKEIKFIKDAIQKDKAVFGVCLGAQLIGEALGAKFDHSPNREIGMFALTLSDAGREDPFFSSFPETFLVGHWHGDMPGLTTESQLLACSEGCPRQIIRYTPKVYGFQCHLEFTPQAIEEMIENCSDELEKYKSLPFIQSPATLRSNDYQEMNGILFKFLDYIESIQMR